MYSHSSLLSVDSGVEELDSSRSMIYAAVLASARRQGQAGDFDSYIIDSSEVQSNASFAPDEAYIQRRRLREALRSFNVRLEERFIGARLADIPSRHAPLFQS